jgi:hypothetical protein
MHPALNKGVSHPSFRLAEWEKFAGFSENAVQEPGFGCLGNPGYWGEQPDSGVGKILNLFPI